MQITTKQLLAIVLTVIMVASAGCAGWDQDGPADNEPNQSNDTDDLEQQNDTNQSNTSDSPNQSGDSASVDDDDGSDSSSGSGDSTESASNSSTDSSYSDSSDDSSESDSATGSSSSDSGGQSGEDSAANGGDSDSSGDDSSGSDDSSGDGSGVGDDDSNGDTGAGSGDGTGDDGTGAGDGNGDNGGDDTGGDDNGAGDGNGDGSGDGDGDGEQQQTNLSIIVVDQTTGEPIEGADVHIYLEGFGIGASATTNSEDVAVFDPNDLPNRQEDRSDGKVRIVVDRLDAEGYQYPEGVEDPSTEIALWQDNSMTIELVPEERETHTLTVHAGEAIPVPNVPITIERLSDGATTTKQTDDNGSVDFTVYPGDYTVSGTDKTGHMQTQDVTVDSDTAVMLGQLQRPQPEERTLTVAVIDQDGDRASGVPVEAVASRLPAGGDNITQGVTDSEGLVEFSVYDGIQYTLSAGGDYTGSATITMDGNEHTTLYVEQRGASSPNETAALSSSGLPDASVSPR